MKSLIITVFSIILFACKGTIAQQEIKIPDIHSNLKKDENGKLYVEKDGKKIYERIVDPRYTLEHLRGDPRGTDDGIGFDFNDESFQGVLYYGFIPYGDSKHPSPVYFYKTSRIIDGKTSINIRDNMSGKYDMINWEKNGKGTIGYRVVNEQGGLLYNGIISFSGKGPFQTVPTIIRGPTVNKVTSNGTTISFITNEEIIAEVVVDGKIFREDKPVTSHEIEITGLEPDKEYDYSIHYGENTRLYSFKTNPLPGSRTKFTFCYASDSRAGKGGGERNLYGVNYYIMRKIMALAKFKKASFMQFSGDLISGYLSTKGQMKLQYANWIRAVEPWWHYMPIYVSQGNHEIYKKVFSDGNLLYEIDNFPFKDNSTESLFSEHFTNPENGPVSEDGAYYDPDPNKQDFPDYKETVYYYIYDNIAVVVLNSHYWFNISRDKIPEVSGNLRDYIMDVQLEWIDKTISDLESDDNIDHIFVTLHTPVFSNGGHVHENMWYHGNNSFRPYVAGKPVEKGIIERRDELLEIIVNKSNKTRAILTGDEHNYSRTEISPETNIYPEDYDKPKVKLSRTIYQINNGAAGAPYYAQEETPWTPYVSGFTTQNALVFFHVDGEKITMEVLNPDTLEDVDYFEFKQSTR